ncbi:Fc.00g103580.m01.CDS01 [Cosmosporella sp. VM-42]
MYTPPDDDADPGRSNRRKACDLCFIKKIKCDMLKPVCSNCKLYNSDCRTSIIRRKPNPAKARQVARKENEQEAGRVDGLESRLARIEDQLQRVLDAAKDAHQPAPQMNLPSTQSAPSVPSVSSVPSASDTPQHALTALHGHEFDEIELNDEIVNGWKFDPVEPCLYEGPEPDALVLPPLEEVLPVVDHYFTVYNPIIPLFHQPTFMKMLNAWYNHRIPRDKAIWAAVHIVMALGYRTPRIGATETAPIQIHKANQCLRNAQAIVSELVTRDEDLLGIQILLGIVMLFQNSRDPKPASVIIGTAVRLAHRLRLHSSDAARFFSPEETEQRSRVFWIAYTLDKASKPGFALLQDSELTCRQDISLRARTPSAQFDDDIDIALPHVMPEDGIGLVWTSDGKSHFNYHRLRVELSYIEGRVYDLLYSNRATKIKIQERQRRVERLQIQLDQWYGRIPSVFQIDHVAQTVGPSQLIQMTKMHHAFLLAEVMTHGIYSRDADWVTRVSTFSRAAIDELSNSALGNRSCYHDQTPPLPEGWTKCVDVARGCMKLFQEAVPTECLIWQCSCSHFSALIILLANMSINPRHELVSLDQHISSKAIKLFDKLLEVVDSEPFQTLRAIIDELYKKANEAVEAAQLDKSRGANVFEGLDDDMNMAPMDQLDFLPLENVFDDFGGTFGSLDGPEVFSATNLDQLPNSSTMGDDLRSMDFPPYMG